jgi:hypothetical protein
MKRDLLCVRRTAKKEQEEKSKKTDQFYLFSGFGERRSRQTVSTIK